MEILPASFQKKFKIHDFLRILLIFCKVDGNIPERPPKICLILMKNNPTNFKEILFGGSLRSRVPKHICNPEVEKSLKANLEVLERN